MLESKHRRRAGPAVAALATALALGCSTATSPAPPPGEAQPAPAPAGSEFGQGTPPATRDLGGGREPLDLATIYFDYDRAAIRPDQKPRLRADAEALRAYLDGHEATVWVEGHCDERGGEEYNLALGERRAFAVRDYLIDLGVPAGAIEVVSFGESRPAVAGHDEAAWRRNRRAELRVAPGG